MEITEADRLWAATAGRKFDEKAGVSNGAEVAWALKSGVSALAKRWIADAVLQGMSDELVLPMTIGWDVLHEMQVFATVEITRTIQERGYVEVDERWLIGWVGETQGRSESELAGKFADRIHAYRTLDYEGRLDAFAHFVASVIPRQYGPPRLVTIFNPSLHAGCRMIVSAAFADERRMQEDAAIHTGMLQLAFQGKSGTRNQAAQGCLVILVGFAGLITYLWPL